MDARGGVDGIYVGMVLLQLFPVPGDLKHCARKDYRLLTAAVFISAVFRLPESKNSELRHACFLLAK